MMVFSLHLWLKGLCGINNDIIITNTITQIRNKTTNATQDQIEFEE